MPYDWATGKPVATLPGYGPRQPLTVGVRGAPPNPFAFMPGPNAPRPTWLPTSLGGTGGIVPKKTTTGTATAKAPTDPWALLLKQVQANYETPAQQEARVNREINAQMAAQQKVMDDEYAKQRADALASFQAQSLAGQAAAAMNKDLFSAVGGEFNAAAGEMKGLAHGLSKNAQGATMGDVAKANAALGALGNAPVMQGGTFGVGGGTQQGVEEYRGGTLAQQMFGAQGEAANFGLAGMIGAQGLQATQEAQAALIKTERDINDNHAKAIDSLNAGRLDLYHTYMADAKDSQIKQISLMQGLIAAKQASAATNAKLKQQTLRDMLSQANRNRTYGLQLTKEQRTAQNQAFNQGATKVRLNQGATRIGLSKAQLGLAQDRETRQQMKDALASGAVDVNRSKALKYVVDKMGRPILDAQGKQIPSSMLSTSTKKGPTAATIARADNLIREWYYGTVAVPGADGKPTSKRASGDQYPGQPAIGQLDYVSALKKLTRMRIPRDTARAMLDDHWFRGSRGRPYLSTEERAAANREFGSTRVDTFLMALKKLRTTNVPLHNALLAALIGKGPLPAQYALHPH